MKKNLIIYGLLIGYLLLNTFVLLPMNLNYYNEIINPFLWIVLCVVIVFLSGNETLRIKGERDKIQSLIIVMIIYIICYFLLGLVFGFEKTPYAKDILSIMKNLWSFVGIVFFQELIRESAVKNEKKNVFNFLIIIILFTILQLNLSNLVSSFTDVKSIFIYVSTTLIPCFLESAILTYLVYIGGFKASVIYRLFVMIPPFIVPIIPNLDWFGIAMVGIVLPMGVYVYLNYIHVKRAEQLSRKERKKYNPIVYVPMFAFIGLLAGFVVGLFKYQPIAVVSGSMSPTFNRGDAAVIRKLTTQEKDKLKVGDVIQFASGTKYVIHRIHAVTNDQYGNKMFVTKGDHNNAPDVGKVHLEEIKGKVSFIIPLIGYPSVWLSGAI